MAVAILIVSCMALHIIIFLCYSYTVELPNNGQVGSGHFVLYMEVVLSQKFCRFGLIKLIVIAICD